jgi:hypothetical protein
VRFAFVLFMAVPVVVSLIIFAIGTPNRTTGPFYLFIALATMLVGYALFKSSGIVLEVGPKGIRDRRLSSVLIPWSAVTDIYTWSMPDIYGLLPQRKYLMVCLVPTFESEWAPLGTRIRKAMGAHVFDWDGYIIGVEELSGGSFEDLEFAAVRFWERAKWQERRSAS